ncbi:tumor necrosis factor receptor type 1-associated DEATH domain protein [Pelodytes ibericus]
MAALPSDWIGSVYLFIQSDRVQLSNLYNGQKGLTYKALSSALSESTEGCRGSIEILKIPSSDTNLILYVKFCTREPCQRFLQEYKARRVHQLIQSKLEHHVALQVGEVTLQLKVNDVVLDDILDKEDECLESIGSLKPSYQKDDELADLDKSFNNLKLESNPQPNLVSSSDSSIQAPQSLLSNRSLQPERSTFSFQGQDYVDRPLTTEHHQLFATMVGKNWKKVGRALEKSCRALRDPAIDNLAFEHEREGLYEQAYQLLLKFIQSEGKKATLQRLVDALVANQLNSIAEALLVETQNGL